MPDRPHNPDDTAFTALRSLAAPVSPDPSFAARLRSRVERALALPKGVTEMLEPGPVTLAGAAVPYLAVRDARRALEWYVDVLGARVVGEPIVMPDGRIGHAELSLAGGPLYLADEHPEIGVVAPAPSATSVSLMLAVPDADAAAARVVAAGGRADREPYDGYGQRNAWVVDPFGHRWGLHSPLAAAATEPAAAATPAESTRPAASLRHGDIAYVSLWTPDVERAAAFFAAVLGWRYAPSEHAQSRQVEGVTPRHGLWGDQQRGTLFCCFTVDDLTAAVQRVRSAGGQAGEASAEPYGRVSDCVDDQGMPFALHQSPAGDSAPANRDHGDQGDLAYVVFEVRDSAAARDFYGAVLGWRYSRGGADDGWNVEGVTPMAGLHGGHQRATVVPMYRVDDIAAAVDRVRRAGGTASDPQRRPYGLEADCADDQGTRFYLGQL